MNGGSTDRPRSSTRSAQVTAAARPELASRKFLGLNGDLDSVGEFIRMYLTRSERWASPLFLVGESYGTTRASGLSGLLVDRGVAFNGVLLISTIMNFQTARFAPGNDLPLILILPSYTATAWYHKKLPAQICSANRFARFSMKRRSGRSTNIRSR